MATLLDLATLEGGEDRSGRLLALARRRDRSACRLERAGVRALPGHFQGRRGAAGDGARHRAGSIGEGHLPALQQLDDLLRTIERALGAQLVVVGVCGKPCLDPLPVAAVEGIDLLAGDLDHLLGGQCFSSYCSHC